jgi:hypothetical protein
MITGDSKNWIEYTPHRKTHRLFRDVIISEKLDGTCGCVLVQPDGTVQAGSKNRLLTLEQDNFGFCAWVKAHEDELRGLGVGDHRGEYWGHGINRAYGMSGGDRRFSLFNVSRWNREIFESNESAQVARSQEMNRHRRVPVDYYPQQFVEPPNCCEVVPVLHRGLFSTETVAGVAEHLRATGSRAMPGFMNPEGVVVFLVSSGHLYKVTLENDGQHKGNL